MTSSTPPNSSSRPVLIWNPDTDASRVAPTVEQAAASLHASPADVLSAISSGDPLNGWFVDWDASNPATSSSTRGS